MDPSTRILINQVLIAVLGSGLTFTAAYFWHRKNAAIAAAKQLADDQRALNQRLVELESQLDVMKQAVVPISAAFQAILIKELTHYHTPRMDELMTKIGPPSTLTDEETTELQQLLEQRTKDMNGRISDSERDAAVMLPMVIKRVKVELASAEVDLQVVSIVHQSESE